MSDVDFQINLANLDIKVIDALKSCQSFGVKDLLEKIKELIALMQSSKDYEEIREDVEAITRNIERDAKELADKSLSENGIDNRQDLEKLIVIFEESIKIFNIEHNELQKSLVKLRFGNKGLNRYKQIRGY
ncbi:MAG: hypothetical protein ACI4V7_02890 [Succinivibrionaceae bacterium]